APRPSTAKTAVSLETFMLTTIYSFELYLQSQILLHAQNVVGSFDSYAAHANVNGTRSGFAGAIFERTGFYRLACERRRTLYSPNNSLERDGTKVFFRFGRFVMGGVGRL